MIGSRLNEATSYGYTLPPTGQRWAHVDLVPSRSGDLPAADLAITSDARAFLRAANERLLSGAVLDAERVAARDANNILDRATWEADTVVDDTPWDGPGVHPGRTIATLRRVLPDEAILTTDAGNFAGWAGRGFRFRRPGTFLGSTSGAMGYGLPAAIAAALVHRDRPVVALVGDGGLAMTMAELETAVRENARVIVVVFDNERYGTIRMWQDRRGSGQGVGTELGPMDFAAIARAVGARGARVDHDDAFEPALARRSPPTVRRSSRSRSTGAGSRSTSRRSDARDVPHGPGRGLGSERPRRPVRRRVAGDRGLHPLHRRRGRAPRHGEPALQRRPAGVPRGDASISTPVARPGASRTPPASIRMSTGPSSGRRSWATCRWSAIRPVASSASAPRTPTLASR